MQPFLSKDTRNKIVEVKVDGLPTSTRFTIFVVEIRALRMDELQNIIGQKRGLLARESNSCPALDYSEGMAAEEQKRYINYLAERVNADDLEKRAMKLVLQDFLDKQKEYDVRLSKLDAVLSEVEEMAATYHSIISTVKMQGRSAWEFLGKFFTKSLIKRVESSLLKFLSVKTLSNIFNGCRDFFSMRPDKFSCQREQNQTCLSYAECSRKS